PIALFIYRTPERWKNLLIVACVSPLLVSAVVRTYGWMVILGDGGLVASILRGLGMVKPPRMVFNTTGVVIGLVDILMAYMILGDGGGVAPLLRGLGMVKAARMVFATTGVVIGLVELLMPGVILALIGGSGRLNASLEEAAASPGARPCSVFSRIVVPLTLPG